MDTENHGLQGSLLSNRRTETADKSNHRMLQVVYNHTLSRQQKIYDRRTKHLSYVEKLLNKLLAEDEIIFIRQYVMTPNL